MMRVKIYPHAVERLKSSLKKICPDIQHTHRLEAMARGLGYRTYAALLADLKAHHEVVCPVDDARFNRWIEEGYERLTEGEDDAVFTAVVKHACLQIMEGGAA